MKFKKRTVKIVSIFTVVTVFLFVYQNCQRQASFSPAVDSASSQAESDVTVGEAVTSCSFNGQVLADGQAVLGYANSSVPLGQTCQSQTRICTNGILSGSNQFASCVVGAAASCLFNGQTVAHGQAITAFANSSVPLGQTCQSQTRICTNGALSGSNQFASCAVGAAASCLFNGQTVAHGQAVLGYANSSVPLGQTCQSQTRICTNGILSGSNQFASCVVGAPQNNVVIPSDSILYNKCDTNNITTIVTITKSTNIDNVWCTKFIINGDNITVNFTRTQFSILELNGKNNKITTDGRSTYNSMDSPEGSGFGYWDVSVVGSSNSLTFKSGPYKFNTQGDNNTFNISSGMGINSYGRFFYVGDRATLNMSNEVHMFDILINGNGYNVRSLSSGVDSEYKMSKVSLNGNNGVLDLSNNNASLNDVSIYGNANKLRYKDNRGDIYSSLVSTGVNNDIVFNQHSFYNKNVNIKIGVVTIIP